MNNEPNIDDLVLWIKSHAQTRNKSAILVEIDNTIGCLVNVLLAKKTGLPIHAIIDFNHTDNNELKRNLCDYYNIDYNLIDPDYASDSCHSYVNIDTYNDKRIKYIVNVKLMEELELTIRSAYIAESSNSLVLSNITRNDYLFTRNYPRLNCWDLMSFADLSMTQLNDFFDKLVPVKSEEINAIVDIAPKPNLEMEWLFEVNERTKIIESESDPTKHPKWYTYTIQQKALIAKVHQIEKATRFKINSNIPIFKLNNV